MRAVCFALVVALAGCSIGAPPGFSSGNSWSFPLVGPLEDGQLITPVFINDKGPYLFAIDPDSPISTIDAAIVSESELYGSLGPRYIDESDTTRQTKMAEVRSIRLGTLTIKTRTLWVSKVGTFSTAGRQIRGVLGRDVIADSLVFGFDRDRGDAYLATQKGFVAPAGAGTIGYSLLTSNLAEDLRPNGRRMVTATIGDQHLRVHLDLGAVSSQLRESKWGSLARVPSGAVLVDEMGIRRGADHGAVGTTTVGPVTAPGLLFVPYADKRWDDTRIDGSLGLGFFKGFAVWANWDQSKLIVVPRGPATAGVKERIARWGSSEIDGCAHVGCVAVELMPSGAPPPSAIDDGAGPVAPAERRRGAVVHITRDASAADLNLEVTLEAVDASGAPLGLPRLVANLPAGTDDVTEGLDPIYDPATLTVVDASPFVRECPAGMSGCVFQLAAP